LRWLYPIGRETTLTFAAHFELRRHGLALFVTPGSQWPVLDVNATPEQVDMRVLKPRAALAVR